MLTQAAKLDPDTLANSIRQDLWDAHRGAFALDGRLIIFGNDEHTASPAKAEVRSMKTWLQENTIMVADFATDASGYSWCIITKPLPAEKLKAFTTEATEALWDAWRSALDIHDGERIWAAKFERDQRRIAARTICSYAA